MKYIFLLLGLSVFSVQALAQEEDVCNWKFWRMATVEQVESIGIGDLHRMCYEANSWVIHLVVSQASPEVFEAFVTKNPSVSVQDTGGDTALTYVLSNLVAWSPLREPFYISDYLDNNLSFSPEERRRGHKCHKDEVVMLASRASATDLEDNLRRLEKLVDALLHEDLVQTHCEIAWVHRILSSSLEDRKSESKRMNKK